MQNKVQNVSNENKSIVINTPDNARIVDLLQSFTSLNEQFAYDIANVLQVIKEIADNTDAQDQQDAVYKFYRISSLSNLLLQKINPEQFHELNSFLNSLKSASHGTN